MGDSGLSDTIEVAEACGWIVAGRSGNGYIHIKCSCGTHQKWLSKTPSDPNYYKHAQSYIRSICGSPKPTKAAKKAPPKKTPAKKKPPQKRRRR